jgi:predicted TIM-barrel fold metal-dependent hydrolase
MPDTTSTPHTAITAIDSHAHVFERGLPLAAQRRHAPDYDALLDEYLGLLDAHGVSHGVLVQPSFLGTDNSYFLKALRAWPKRLRGVVMLDPGTDEGTLTELDALGVRGLRLNLVGLPLPDLKSSEWQGMLARLRALDWHVELHRGSSDLMQCVQPVLDAGCRVVVDHFGRPENPQTADDAGFNALLRAGDTGRIWVKLAAGYRNWPRQEDAAAGTAAQALLANLGAERLVWGSDWPNTQHREIADFGSAQAVLAQWIPDPAARHRILVDTPAELFRFD